MPSVLAVPIQFAPHCMTAASLPAPFVASASSESAPGTAAYFAFNGNSGIFPNTYWEGDNSGVDWLKIDLGVGNLRILGSYTLWMYGYADLTTAPKNWTLEGSNNNIAWDILDTVTGAIDWFTSEKRSFTCDVTTTAYRYFRINITANNGHATLTTIAELYLNATATIDTTVYRPTANVIVPGNPTTLGSVTDPELGYDEDTDPPTTFAINERHAFSPLSDPYILNYSAFSAYAGPTPDFFRFSFWSSFSNSPTYGAFANLVLFSNHVPIPFTGFSNQNSYPLYDAYWDLSASQDLTIIDLNTRVVGTLLGGGTSLFNVYDVYITPFYPLALDCGNPPNGVDGDPYSHQLEISGGQPAYYFTITAGALPTGITLSATTGLLSGTPTVVGPFSFTVGVIDTAGATDSVACSITIDAASQLSISCNNPCEAVLDVPYNHTFTAADGTAPYLYTITAGALPTGLSLDFTSGIASGRPSVIGLFNFTVTVTDADEDTDSTDCSINVTEHVCPWHLCDLFSISEDCAMTGTVGLRRTADGVLGGSDVISSTPITVVAGEVYFVEFFLRGSGGADGTISVGFDFYDENDIYLSSGYVTSTGSPVVFTSFTGTVTVPADAVTAVPVIKATNHLAGIWCISAIFSSLMDQFFVLSSIKHYFSDWISYR